MTWWNEFFDREVAELILEQPRPGELQFLVQHLGLKAGDRVFDQCCGWGRISGPLAGLGYSVDGVDSSHLLIRYGSEYWDLGTLDLICADAHCHQTVQKADAAVNLYSSFGYDEDESKHAQMLSRLARSVKSGGRVILDTINPERVWQDFQPEMLRNWPSGYHLRRRSELRSNGRHLHQEWSFTRPNGERFHRTGTTRLYTPEELKSMMTQVGLKALELMGDLQSEPLSRESERLIVVAEKVEP